MKIKQVFDVLKMKRRCEKLNHRRSLIYASMPTIFIVLLLKCNLVACEKGPTIEAVSTTSEIGAKITDGDCSMINQNIELSDQNILTVTWDLNANVLNTCSDSIFTFNLTRENCSDDNCSITADRVTGTDQNYTFKDALIACANYKLEIFDNMKVEDNLIWQADIQSRVLGQIKLEVSQNDVNSPNTTLKWEYLDAPESCPKLFDATVYLGSSLKIQLSSIDGFNRTVEGLEPCETYNFSVYPINSISNGDIINYTLKLNLPSNVEDLIAMYRNDTDNIPTISVTWKEPTWASKCVKDYHVEIMTSPTPNLHGNRNTSNMNLDISNVYACIDYTISVSPRTENDMEAAAVDTRITVPARIFNKPTLNITNITASSATVSTIFGDQYNSCKPTDFIYEMRENDSDEIRDYKESENSLTIEGLEAFTSYIIQSTVVNEAGASEKSDQIEMRTSEGVPTPPQRIVSVSSSQTCELNWELPSKPNGEIRSYTIRIEFSGFNYIFPEYCSEKSPFPSTFENVENFVLKEGKEGKEAVEVTLSSITFNYTFESLLAAATYAITLKASTNAGDGEFSDSVICSTKPASPEQIGDLKIEKEFPDINTEYNNTTIFSWLQPCLANGNIGKFYLNINPVVEGFSTAVDFDGRKERYMLSTDQLKPDTNYSINIYASLSNEDGNLKGNESEQSYFNIGGYPILIYQRKILHDASANKIKLEIPNEVFDSPYGDVEKISVYVEQVGDGCGEISEAQHGLNDDDTSSNVFWTNANANETCMNLYKAADIGRSTAAIDGNIKFVLGTNENCLPSTLCNGPLRPGKYFQVRLRHRTLKLYSDLLLDKIKMDNEVPLVLVVSIIASSIVTVFFIGLWITYWKTVKLRNIDFEQTQDNKDINSIDFPRYYEIMRENSEIRIKDEYTAINAFSETLNKTCIASRSNAKLNRYSNISPFDDNRVVLEGGEFENEYINASFIDGYVKHHEYIAAQGPLAATSYDFWRMIIQYRIEQIVMLTDFMEDNKSKCHQYFPKANGAIKFAGIRVTCVDEINTENYSKRRLQIQTNTLVRHVEHFHFKSWPDHGVPNQPEPLIEFCRMLRKERKQPDGKIVVHCSAGVGRTGTLIAIDIIIQRLKQEKKINIYELVKQLRTQRVKMVQSVSQYSFIYQTAMALVSDGSSTNWKVLHCLTKLMDVPKKSKKSENDDIQLNSIPSVVKNGPELIEPESPIQRSHSTETLDN